MARQTSLPRRQWTGAGDRIRRPNSGCSSFPFRGMPHRPLMSCFDATCCTSISTGTTGCCSTSGAHEAKAGRGKQFFPLTFGTLDGRRGWQQKAPSTPRPLYGLDRLSHSEPTATVILTEGEKAADAAMRMFPDHVAMSWMGGAQSVEHADYSPIKNRDVVIWPDADKPGAKAAALCSRSEGGA